MQPDRKFIEEQSPFRICFSAVGSPQQEILALALKTQLPHPSLEDSAASAYRPRAMRS